MVVNSKEIFTDDDERAEVKSWLDLFEGVLTQVIDSDGTVLFRSKLCVDI